MTSKDYLEKVTIGNLAELSEKIILDEYNPHWKLMFQRERLLSNMSAPPQFLDYARNRLSTFFFWYQIRQMKPTT